MDSTLNTSVAADHDFDDHDFEMESSKAGSCCDPDHHRIHLASLNNAKLRDLERKLAVPLLNSEPELVFIIRNAVEEILERDAGKDWAGDRNKRMGGMVKSLRELRARVRCLESRVAGWAIAQEQAASGGGGGGDNGQLRRSKKRKAVSDEVVVETDLRELESVLAELTVKIEGLRISSGVVKIKKEEGDDVGADRDGDMVVDGKEGEGPELVRAG
ncbi:hypothetical protein C8A00DRAFT_38514 [Chaetomidium leptoderma]|uniref:Uncharacterized protein n=1 Tax=Chaetomidium leptoderma TaxID=669021 RepID=A0AAN6VCM7_9PEZI|nr:hypothetical protein C8A00DRAFT_38514 [Chaetomidium leptoderma]